MVNEEIILRFTVQEEHQFLCKISGSLFTSFTCFYIVVVCIVRAISQTGIKGLTTNYIPVTMRYSGRKLVYLQIFEFIGATVSEFRFFMRIKENNVV